MSSSVANIRIEPVDVSWRQFEKEIIDFSNTSAASFGGKYFTIDLPTGVSYYVWGNENSGDTDPAVAGKTGIEVAYAASASASAIASAAQAAIDAITGFTATVSSAVVTVVRSSYGACEDATIGDTTDIAITKEWDGKDVYLGLLQGDVSVAFSETLLEIKAHQSGETPRADLRQGMTAVVSLVVQESDNALRKALLTGSAGGTHTPSGGTELYGWGDIKLGLSTTKDAGRLILHPVALASNDYTRDMCFWLAYPQLKDITFSGSNPEVMSVDFKCYLDSTKASGVNLFAFGDHTQDV